MDMVIWKDGDRELKFPRLTDDERNKISEFVHKVPPNGDACPHIFNLLIRFARETIDTSDNTWNVNKYYDLLISELGKDLVSHDKNVEHPYKNVFHDHIKVKRATGDEVIVADEDRVIIAMGTYCPWDLVNTKQINCSLNYIRNNIILKKDC